MSGSESDSSESSVRCSCPRCWVSPALDKVDRLSTLPPELLSRIFDEVCKITYERYPRPLVISNWLWPYARPIIYEVVELRSVNQLSCFLRTIGNEPAIAHLVKRLTIALESAQPDEVAAVKLPLSPAEFWGAFVRLFKIDLLGCFDLTQSILKLTPLSKVQLAKLEMVDLRGEWNEWGNPFAPKHFANLFKLAPKLRYFQLIVRRKINSTRTSLAKTPPVRLSPKLDSLVLLGPITGASTEVAELCHAFGRIGHLYLSERYTPINLAKVYRKLGGAQIEHLTSELMAFNDDGEMDNLDGSNFQPSMRHLTSLRKITLDFPTYLDPDLVDTLPRSLVTLELRYGAQASPLSLLATARAKLHKLPNLKTLTVDHLPGRATRLADSAKRGPRIMRDFGPVLAARDDGSPIFEPLPGWKLPAFNEDPGMAEYGDEFELMRDAIGVARGKGVEVGGDLVEVTRVREEWEAEKGLCEELKEEYEEGELEWRVWREERECGDCGRILELSEDEFESEDEWSTEEEDEEEEGDADEEDAAEEDE